MVEITEGLHEKGVAALISRLSRHQAAFCGRSDLKIGHATVNSDYLESIQMLTEMRRLLFQRESAAVDLATQPPELTKGE